MVELPIPPSPRTITSALEAKLICSISSPMATLVQLDAHGSLDRIYRGLRSSLASRSRNDSDLVSEYATSSFGDEPRDSRHHRVRSFNAVSYTHLRAHETVLDLVCRLLL